MQKKIKNAAEIFADHVLKMKTWWIVKVHGYNPIITVVNLGQFYQNAIGPYFSYKEAMQVLHRWSK